jgi:RimJ/RimL family protein N-acetyltransferase
MKIVLLPLAEPRSIAALWVQVCEKITPLEAAFGPEGRAPRPRPQDTYYLAVDEEYLEAGWTCGDGCIGLVYTQRPSPTTMTFALALFPIYRGQGYGPVLRDATIAHCFADPAIFKVESEVYSSNAHSLGALHGKHARTKPEGIQRATICVDGTFYDRRLFGLTRSEWEATG